MSLQVNRHISGSHCVVVKTREHYLDARKRYVSSQGNRTDIEIVRDGRVYYRETVDEKDAPERIIVLIKEKML
jgi:hypothetical protein